MKASSFLSYPHFILKFEDGSCEPLISSYNDKKNIKHADDNLLKEEFNEFFVGNSFCWNARKFLIEKISIENIYDIDINTFNPLFKIYIYVFEKNKEQENCTYKLITN